MFLTLELYKKIELFKINLCFKDILSLFGFISRSQSLLMLNNLRRLIFDPEGSRRILWLCIVLSGENVILQRFERVCRFKEVENSGLPKLDLLVFHRLTLHLHNHRSLFGSLQLRSLHTRHRLQLESFILLAYPVS
jgi:hypothetical protein